MFLAEAHTCLGGMGTAGRVPTFMTFSDGVHFLAAGFGQQVLKRMKKDSTTRKCFHIDN